MFRGLKGRLVVLNVTSEAAAFRGTLFSVGLRAVRLTAVMVLEPDGRQVPLEGVARFPRRTVTWIQEL